MRNVDFQVSERRNLQGFVVVVVVVVVVFVFCIISSRDPGPKIPQGEN